MKKILITGQHSYIGTSVEKYLSAYNNRVNVEKIPYNLTTISVYSDENNHGEWERVNFGLYDAVLHVAGKAHSDVGKVSEETKKLYYRINTELTLAVARKAKTDGCKQFIYMSSMIVYGGAKHITADTEPRPSGFYGDSKWQADKALQEMNNDLFRVVIIRSPMIYGKNSKGNYRILAKMATKLPFFPVVNNQRSILHIDNLCEFIRLVIDNTDSGVFWPQNSEYSNTSMMVKIIADVKDDKIIMLHGVAWLIQLLMLVPGKIGRLAKKAFGSSYYEMNMSEYKTNYRINDLRKSIELTER